MAHLSHSPIPRIKRAVLGSLPKAATDATFARIAGMLAARPSKLVVLDDDPTGCQTMHDIDVLAEWSHETLVKAFTDTRLCFYILTNSRSLGSPEAAALTREIARALRRASEATQVAFTVVSRSDSTLRGHFKEETDALRESLGPPIDATLVIPAFFEGGRFTLNDTHYVAEGDDLVPAADTEFARDKTFGYAHSTLPEWIEEKTKGTTPARDVVCVSLGTLRSAGGGPRVRDILLGVPRGSYVVVNATEYSDLEVFVEGLLMAEAAGRTFLSRTAAGFVRVRSGTAPRPPLDPDAIAGKGPEGGLIVVGSYVAKSTAQLQSLQALATVVPIEMRADALAQPDQRLAEVERVATLAAQAMARGRHAVVFTSREPHSALGTVGELKAGAIVSEALVEVVRRIPLRPRFLVAKGGITSCEIATKALGMRAARVVGQAVPGVPVWKMGDETRFPGLNYVVWPGNVGGTDDLRALVSRL